MGNQISQNKIDQDIKKLENRVSRLEGQLKDLSIQTGSYGYPCHLPVFKIVRRPPRTNQGYRIVKRRSNDNVTVYRKRGQSDQLFFDQKHLNSTFE